MLSALTCKREAFTWKIHRTTFNIRLVNREISRILWKLSVLYRVHNITQLVPILRADKIYYTIYLFIIRFNIILFKSLSLLNVTCL